jgi:transposase
VEAFTVKEISKHLGKSEKTVKRWIWLGKFSNAYFSLLRR